MNFFTFLIHAMYRTIWVFFLLIFFNYTIIQSHAEFYHTDSNTVLRLVTIKKWQSQLEFSKMLQLKCNKNAFNIMLNWRKKIIKIDMKFFVIIKITKWNEQGLEIGVTKERNWKFVENWNLWQITHQKETWFVKIVNLFFELKQTSIWKIRTIEKDLSAFNIAQSYQIEMDLLILEKSLHCFSLANLCMDQANSSSITYG